MKKRLIKIYNKLLFWGIDPKKAINNLKGLSFYYSDLKKIKKQKGNDQTFSFGKTFMILDEKNKESGNMKGHYFHQDLHVAKLVFKAQPKKHVDIGSRIDGFVAHVASFREIEIIDIRKQKNNVENITTTQLDLMQLPQDKINYCDSISSLHAIEHFGLGRYGDPIDYYGHIKAINNITKILQKGGRFYFSVPIGTQRIEFNAQRIFSLDYLIEQLLKDYKVQSFSYVDDMGDFHKNVELTKKAILTNFNCNFGCGIFELIKL